MILKLSPSTLEYIYLIRELSVTPSHQFHHLTYGVPSGHVLMLCAHDLKGLRRDNMGAQHSLFLSRPLPGVFLGPMLSGASYMP